MSTLFPADDHTSNDMSSWHRIRTKLLEILPETEFSQWIAPISVKSESSDEIVLELPNMTAYQTIIDSFIDKLEFCKSSLDIAAQFQFEIKGSERNPEKAVIFEASEPKQEKESTPKITRALTHNSFINPEYRFNNFVNGPSNQFAHASCLAVADAPGQNYNPLFLYGSTGLGKTHLLHSVGNAVLKDRSNAIVTYISSERFMNEMIYCLRFNKMWDFRRKYRSCDVLLVDDIQFISGKERTQEEFFHTFNSLYEAKKQIIVTSDIFPQEIPDIEDRLRNRFQWGLIADIQPPDIEHRVAILMSKAEKQGVSLSGETAQYIASQAKGSVRVLEGALRRVSAYAVLHGRQIDLQLASEVLQNVFGEPQKSLTIEHIQKLVADHFKIRTTDLKSKKRQRAFSLPRQIAMFLSRSRTTSSFPEIGEKFGGKDHSTVMHAVKKIEQLKGQDLDIKSNLESLDRKLDQLS